MSDKPAKPIFFQPSNIETIDFAMFRWLDETMNVFCNTNKGFEKVPVVWVTGERSAQLKEKDDVRDIEGTLILPRITLERKDFEKDPAFRGAVTAHHPNTGDYKGGTFPAFRVINQRKTSNFANAQSFRTTKNRVGTGQINFKTKKKHPTVYTTYHMPQPTYMKITYEIHIKTEYQQQINEIMQPFLTYTGHITTFMIEHENHKYECFFDSSFNQDNNVSTLNEDERKYESKFSIRCMGYLIGGNKNEKYPFFTKRENAVKFFIGKERTILGED